MMVDPRYLAAEDRLWRSLGTLPRDRRVDLRRLGVTVRVQEVGDGPPILFIHGGSTCGTSWAELAVGLPVARCLLLDRPGTGASEALPVAPRSVGELAALADDLILDVLDALDLERADIVATSFGGWFGFRAALAAPHRLRRLVLFGWTAGAPVGRLPITLRMGVMPIVGDLLGRMPVDERAVRAIFRSIGSGPALAAGRISTEAIEAYAALLRWTPTFANDRALGRLFFSARGVDAQIELTPSERERIQVPIDWLWGGGDAFAGPEIARSFVDPFQDARLTIAPMAGHAPWLDDLDGATEFVRSALVAGGSDC